MSLSDHPPELEALASRQGSDAARIDRLVDDVAVVKGKVEKVDKGIDELRSALAVLVRHEVVMEQHAKTTQQVRTDHSELDKRVRLIELEMPQLREARGWAVKAVLAVVSVFGLALAGLVIKVGAP